MKDIELLKAKLAQILAAPDLKPENGVTHCNQAVQRVASAFGFDFPQINGEPMMADAMVDFMNSSPRWVKAIASDAALWASMGGLAVAGKKYSIHGHVACVAPLPMEFSGSWNCDVPVLANIGQTVGYLKESEDFPVALGQPTLYILDAKEA